MPEAEMAQFYFHFTSSDDIVVDRRGTELEDMAEAHARALDAARSLMTVASGLHDWRDWLVHVTDEEGDDVLVLPFTFARGKLH